MFKKLLSVVSTIALALTFGIQAASAGGNDRLMKVMDRGKIVIGVKADYKPWGFRNASGKLVGMEIDMAQDVADALGVELELVPVQSSNRMQFVQQGKIDMMIATMSDKADRRKIVGIIDPNYYTSGTMASMFSPRAAQRTSTPWCRATVSPALSATSPWSFTAWPTTAPTCTYSAASARASGSGSGAAPRSLGTRSNRQYSSSSSPLPLPGGEVG